MSTVIVFLVSIAVLLNNLSASNATAIITPSQGLSSTNRPESNTHDPESCDHKTTTHGQMTKEQLVIEIERLLKEPSEKPQFNVCDRLPCKNGGFCKPIGTSDYSCECPQNTTGVNCEKVLVCTLNTCPINAECSISNYQILCTCKHGYVKNQTECEPYDECEHRKPCQNGGKCISLQAAAAVDVTSKLYRCECPRHTTGENCEVVLQCTPTSCSNNANCFVDNHQINCVCKSGFATDDQGDCTVKIRQAHVWGEPHYTTFDGLQYDYQGTCPYTLTKPCNYDIDPKFSIRAQNKVYNFDKRVSVVTWVELTIYGHTFKVHENLTLIVDGTIVSVPYQLFIPGDDKWKVKADISSGQMRITTREHIEISFYPNTLYVTVPEDLVSGSGRLCGLFGDVDNKCENDLRGVMNNLFGIPTGNCIWPTEGPIAMVAEKFGDDWIDDFENGACIPGSIFKNSSLPCSPDEYMAAKKMCQAIEEAKSGKGIFAKCVSLGAQLDELFNGCSYDVCADPALRCAALTAFVHTCQKAIPGTRLSGWRESLSCPLVCPANQSYSECVSGCQPTCANTTTKAVCDKPCIEGCVCSYGTVLDGTGLNCIPQEHCGCIDKTNGNYYEAGSIWMNADCTKTYKCLEFGNMIDKDVTCGERATCSTDHLGHVCTCQSASAGTCMTPEETIAANDKYHVCDCKI